MLKTNRFKTLLVLLATVLGLTGIQASSYADNATDRKTVANMALTFSKYSGDPSKEALEWVEKNTTGKAKADPYRNMAPNKSIFNTVIKSPQNIDIKVKIRSVDVMKKLNTAIAVVARNQQYNTPTGRFDSNYLQKIWFKKIDGKWKISDYYTLITDATLGGKPYDLNAPHDSRARMPYDSVGTKFPK